MSNDVELQVEIENKFLNAMLGISELPHEYPGIYYTNFLKAAYNEAKAMNLSENLILKHCCTVLSQVIKNNQIIMIREKLNHAGIKISGS